MKPEMACAKRGFTLAQLMVVVGIIAAILSVAVPQYSLLRQRAREVALRRLLRTLRESAARFKTDLGGWPYGPYEMNYPDRAAFAPNNVVFDSTGNVLRPSPTLYNGPYLSATGSTISHPYKPYVPSAKDSSGMGLAPVWIDPISNDQVAWSVFDVKSSATGNDSNGVPYSSY